MNREQHPEIGRPGDTEGLQAEYDERLATYRRHARLSDPVDASKNYAGIPIYAIRGVHEAAAAQLTELLPAKARVADLGAGAGALSRRLFDMGLAVTAFDAVPENFRPAAEIVVHRADLNRPIVGPDEGWSFDGVAAVEVIEHLENPYQFMRTIASLLRADGVAVVTTPSVEHPATVLRMLRFGDHKWFNDHEVGHNGHITPLSLWQLRTAARLAGLRVVRTFGVGSLEDELRGWWKMRAVAKLLGLVSRRDAATSSEILGVVLRKIGADDADH